MTGFYPIIKLWFLLLFCLSWTSPLFAQCSFTNLDPEYCSNAPSFTLTGSTNYYGPGVSGTTFDPSAAGVGTHTLYATSGSATAYNVVTTGTFNRIIASGTTVNPGDNGQVAGVSIPFTFNFYGNNYTQINIGRNAIVGFGPTAVDANDNATLPSGTDPDNFIAAAWDDLDAGGTIQYFTTGTAPFRKFVIDYANVPREGGVYNITTQIQLHESTNIIEIHTALAQFGANGNFATQGIENSDGSAAFVVPGRNNDNWDAVNDYVSFVPTCLDIQTVNVNAAPSASLGVSPASAAICPSGTVAVTVTGDESGVNYQLQNNADSSPLSGFLAGDGSGNLVLTSDPISSALTLKVYAVNLTTGCETDLTTTVPVTVNAAPAITVQPVASQTFCEGTANVSFSVTATGDGLTYQWKKNGINIGGATAATYIIATATTADAGTYTVEVSGTCSPGVTSNGSVLIVQEQPEITVQPVASQTVCENQPVTLSVNAGATTNPSYQWYKGAVLIPGATSSTFSIGSAALSDAGSYTVEVSGTCGPPVTSNPSILNVNSLPTAFGSDTQICSGGTTSIAITNPNSIPGTTFTWTVQSSTNVSGATAGAGSIIAQTLTSTDGTDPGTVIYLIQPTAAGCNGPTYAVNVTVNPIPDATASDQTICSGQSSSVAITNPNGVAGTTFSWIVQSSSNVSGASAGSGTLISQVLSSTDGVNSGSVTYRITPTANGCSGSTFDVTVTVNPVPVITNTATQLQTTICSGTALNFTPTSSVAGTTYTWTSVTIGTVAGISANGSGAITDTPVNTGNTAGIVIYTITPSVGSCDGTARDYIVTVNPIPDALAADQGICSGQSSSVVISNPNGVPGTTYSWIVQTSTNVSGASAGSGSLISQVLTSTDGVSSGTVVYQITPSAGGCNGTPITVTVTVSPAPVITNTAAQLQATICSGVSLNFTPTSSITGTTFTWTSLVLGPVSGVTASGGGAITDTPINTGNIAGTITYTITPTIAGCNGTPRDYVVTVSPIPDVFAADEGICSGQSTNVVITNPNGVVGTTFNWIVQSSTNVTGAANGSGNVIGQVLTSTDGVSSGSVVYQITPVSSGCNGTPITVTVTVSPSPVITNTSTQLQTTICSGIALNFTPTSSIVGTTYSWTSVVSGPISGITASGNGAITDTPVNTGNVVGTVTYTITPTVGGCSGTPRDYVVTVNPIPDVFANDQAICSGEATNVIINNPSAVTGTTFSWVIQSSSNVSGASNGSGNVISQVLTSTDGINSGSVVYRITPSANGCNGSTIDITVTVSPKPVITDPSTSFIADICSGEALNLLPTSSVAGTTFSWTSSVIGTLSGVSASGTGAITDAPVNSTNVSGVIIYTVTPSFGGCNGNAVNYVVTVKPIPDVAAADETICSGLSTNISISNPNGVTGTTFSWVIQSATNVTGASAGSGNVISQVLTSTDGITNGAVVYRITPSANNCSGSFIDVTVTVKPVPVVTNNPTDLSQQICSGDALNFLPTTSIVGATFTWTSVASGPIDPSSVTASGSSSITDAPINTGNVSGTVTYHITPSFNGCDGPDVDLVVLVRPLPTASASDITICSGENAVINILPSPNNVAGTTFSWTVTPSGNVTGAASGNGSTINQVLNTTDANVGTVVYTVIPAANGCNGLPLNVTVTVNPKASVSAGSDFAVCEPITIPLSGILAGSATSGTWTIISGSGTLSPSITTGTNVTATYTVASADIGTSLTFRITTNDPDNAGPCVEVFDEVVVNVNRQARLTLPADYSVCEPFSIGLAGLLSGSATSGSWSIISGAGILSASSVTGADVTATYVLDNPTDVSSTLTFRLTTNDPDGTGPCVAEFDEINITVNESAKVDAATSRFNNEFCENEPIQLTGTISGATSSVTWSGGSGAAQFGDVNNPNTTYTLTAADIAAGSITLTLTTNDPDGIGPCTPASDQVVVIINPLPAVFLSGLAPSYAENDPPVLMDGFPNSPPGMFSGPGVLAGTNIFDPGNANIGSNTITYTYTDNKNCQNSASRIVVVNELTDIDFEVFNGVSYVGGLTPEICGDIGRAYLRGSPPVSTGLTPTVDTYFSSPDIPSRIGYDGTNYYLDTDGLAAGAYYIQYTYTNNLSATSTVIKEVTVYASPVASIIANNACENDVVQFTDASAVPPNALGGVVDTWLWDFDDQDLQSPLQNPTYTYANANIYDVSLRVTTNQGCTNSTVKTITVGPPPVVDFTWSGICNTQSTQFADQSTINVSFSTIERYQWDFGDGDITLNDLGVNAIPPGTHGGRTTGTYKDPSHAYASSNEYDVRLTVETDVGCVKDVVKRVFILDYPTATPTMGYHENFESGSGTWFKTSLSGTSWIFGTPTGTTINSAGSGSNAWWTGTNADFSAHNGTYLANENSEVIGPCLDLSGLERPMISLNYWSDLQMGFDGAVVQYSVDGGASWVTIGDGDGGGIDWYNSTNLSGNPGGQDNYAWSDSTSGWRNARFNLDQIPQGDRDQVIFRIAFGSNNDNPFGRELNGFAFDDVYIGEKHRNVLVEYFTNRDVAGEDDFFDGIYDAQLTSREPDFFKLQYHVEGPEPDSINIYNRTVPAARGLLYGVSQPPAAIMDGLLGWHKASPTDSTFFNGNYAVIDEVEIDRRSLVDPLFNISLTVDPPAPGEESKVKGQVILEYADSLQSLSDALILNLALVDDDALVNYTDGTGAEAHRFVVRKLLLGNEGMLIQANWSYGQTQQITFEQNIDVPITSGGNQRLVVFVQDRYATNGSSRVIHQSLVSQPIQRQGVKPVGLEDDPIAAEVRSIQIYPNPANNVLKFNLQNQLTRHYTWKMIDQRGITVLDGDVNQSFDHPQEIDISKLANGIYFIQIGIGDTSIIYRKIAVMNRN